LPWNNEQERRLQMSAFQRLEEGPSPEIAQILAMPALSSRLIRTLGSMKHPDVKKFEQHDDNGGVVHDCYLQFGPLWIIPIKEKGIDIWVGSGTPKWVESLSGIALFPLVGKEHLLVQIFSHERQRGKPWDKDSVHLDGWVTKEYRDTFAKGVMHLLSECYYWLVRQDQKRMEEADRQADQVKRERQDLITAAQAKAENVDWMSWEKLDQRPSFLGGS